MRTRQSLNIADAVRAMREGSLQATDLMAQCLESNRRFNPQLNAVLHLTPDAMKLAARCDAEMAEAGPHGLLHGIPLIVKDNIDVAGMPSTVGSALFANARPRCSSARVIDKLQREGAIILGKANMDELAAHVSGRTSCHGPSINPWRMEERFSPGGSSSGTAAAVAAGLCWGGLGTDTGGSVRLPASWCGLCGLRPTHGSVSLDGVYPRAASLDTVGALARSVQDVALLMEAMMEGENSFPRTPEPEERQPRIGVLPGVMESAAPVARDAWSRNLRRWKELGTCVPIEFPLLEDPEVAATVDLLRSYEFARDVERDMEADPGAMQKIHAGALADYRRGKSLTASDYARALERKGQFTRTTEDLLARQNLDFLLLPVSRATAPRVDAPAEEFSAARSLVNLFSITEGPSLTLPGEQVEGMPLGMQLVGARGADGALLRSGMAYERLYGPFPRPL